MSDAIPSHPVDIDALALASGSDWLYSRLFLPRDRQVAFNALLALRTEVAAQLARVSDAAVAEAKLEWWRQEIERAAQGHGSHPLAADVTSLCRHHGIAAEYLLELIDAIDMRLLPGRLQTVADEKLFRYRHDGVLAELACLLAGEDSRDKLALARTIGEIRAHVDALRTLATQLQQGELLFAAETVAAAGLDPHAATDEALQRFLTAQWQHWDHLRIAARTMMQDSAPATVIAVQWALLEHDYRKLQARRGELPRRQPRLAGPLRRLFIAWRAATRSRRETRN